MNYGRPRAAVSVCAGTPPGPRLARPEAGQGEKVVIVTA